MEKVDNITEATKEIEQADVSVLLVNIIKM